MNARNAQGGDLQSRGKPRSREEAIPKMSCTVHKHEELSSRIEQYSHTPQSEFSLPASTHHWLISQANLGPQHFLVQAGEQECDISGLNRQQLVYIPPGTKTEWDFSPAEGSSHLLIPDKLLFQASASEREFAAIQEQGPLFGTVMPRVSQLINGSQGRHCCGSNPSDLALSEFILEAADLLAQELSSRRSEVRKRPSYGGVLDSRALQDLEDFMWGHIERNISLSDLAHLVHLSPFHFSRSFKEKTQETPHQALLRIRVRKARALLLRDVSLTEIAYRCGFSDQAHFTRVFKTQTGFTPKLFRKATA